MGALLLKAPHSLWSREHVDCEIPNNFDTACVLRACCSNGTHPCSSVAHECIWKSLYNDTCIWGLVPCSGGSHECKCELLHYGTNIRFCKTYHIQAKGVDDHPQGENYQLLQCKRFCRSQKPRMQGIFLPPHCMYLLHFRLIQWKSMGPHSLSMRLQVVVATILMASMTNHTPNCYQPHINLQQRNEKFQKESTYILNIYP